MAKKIKIKDVEGDSEELAKFFAAADCRLQDYLDVKENPKVKGWMVIVAGVLFLILSILIWVLPPEYTIIIKVLTLTDLFTLIVETVLIQLYWDKGLVTVIFAIGAILVMLVAENVLTPQEALEQAEQKLENHQSKFSE